MCDLQSATTVYELGLGLGLQLGPGMMELGLELRLELGMMEL